MRKLIMLFTVSALAVTLLAVGASSTLAAQKKVTVGNKNFTEQYVIGELIKQLLEERGFEVDLKADLTSMALREGMESGDIDICADYTGTAWMVHLKREYKPGIDNNMLFKKVKKQDVKNGFVWQQPIWNNNTYALAAWPEFAEKHNLETLSDLAAFYRENDGKVSTFIDFEFSTRPDGLPALQQHYKFKIAKDSLKTGTPGASLIGLREHAVKVAMVFGTDASIAEHGWTVFQDDKAFFPPYDLTPYVREEIVEQYPAIEDILYRLVDTFPGGCEPATPQIVARGQAAWQELNAEVDKIKKEPSKVAHDYLVQHGLIE
jgi:osmoprotectant transport system substrate-binding protein